MYELVPLLNCKPFSALGDSVLCLRCVYCTVYVRLYNRQICGYSAVLVINIWGACQVTFSLIYVWHHFPFDVVFKIMLQKGCY